LEKLIRDGGPSTDVGTATRELSAAVAPLLTDLQNALGSTETALNPQPPALNSPDPAQVRAAAAQLSKLLSEFDPLAVEFLEGNQRVLQSLFSGETWGPFEKLVQGYAFPDARARLEEALQKLPAA